MTIKKGLGGEVDTGASIYVLVFFQNGNDRTSVGEIHLKGHWLIEAGFSIDAPVKVRVMQGCLVVTAE